MLGGRVAQLCVTVSDVEMEIVETEIGVECKSNRSYDDHCLQIKNTHNRADIQYFVNMPVIIIILFYIFNNLHI